MTFPYSVTCSRIYCACLSCKSTRVTRERKGSWEGRASNNKRDDWGRVRHLHMERHESQRHARSEVNVRVRTQVMSTRGGETTDVSLITKTQDA